MLHVTCAVLSKSHPKAVRSSEGSGGLCLRACLALQDVKLSDLQKIGVLGSGAFGQVCWWSPGRYLALKTLSKPQIVDMGLQASLDRVPLMLWHHAPPCAVQLTPHALFRLWQKREAGHRGNRFGARFQACLEVSVKNGRPGCRSM